MKGISPKFILFMLFAVSLVFTVGFLSGSFLSYKNCLIKYEYERRWGEDIPINLYVLERSLKHVFEYPTTYPGSYTLLYPIEIVDHALFNDNYFYLALRNNKETKIKILANSVNLHISGKGGCGSDTLDDIEISPNERILIRLKCDSRYGGFEAGKNYMAHLNTTFINLSSGDKIDGYASLWGVIEKKINR